MGCGQGKAKIIALVGSLRAGSKNLALVKYLQTLKSEEFEIQIADIGFLPLYDEDLQKDKKIPVSVDVLREQVKGATALIFATPEYNGSMSGVLKNAYDWLSRDYSKQGGDTPPVAGKKSGILCASYLSKNPITDVRKMGEYCKVNFAPSDFYVSLSQDGVFNDKSELVSEDQKKKLQKWLADFILFVSPNAKIPAPK